jgi:quercetin dioxygenase-like cupin family protein
MALATGVVKGGAAKGCGRRGRADGRGASEGIGELSWLADPTATGGLAGSPNQLQIALEPTIRTTPVATIIKIGTGDPGGGREVVMLTRRGFAGFAPCAICAVAGFVATDASAAESAPPAATPGVTRKILSQMDGPMPGYVTVVVEAEIEAGVMVARHTHPGIESSYVLEGEFDLPVQGQPTLRLKSGDAYQVPPETPHAGAKVEQKVRITSTYVVEKGKPLASPA